MAAILQTIFSNSFSWNKEPVGQTKVALQSLNDFFVEDWPNQVNNSKFVGD